MPKVLLVIGDAAEVLDTFYAYFRIQEEGIEVDVAAPEVRRYHLVQHERPEGWDLTQETPGYHLESSVAFRDVDPDDYLGLFITGGRAPEYLRYDDDLMRITRSFFVASKPVASLCHGIEILAAAGVLKGLTAATVPKCQYDVEFSGGSYANQPVVRSGNLVTARTWSDNAPFLREFVEMLNEARSTESAA